VDDLLAIEPQPLPVRALLHQHLLGLRARVRRADEIDGAGQVCGARGRRDGGARVQELGQAGGARQREVEGEVLGGED